MGNAEAHLRHTSGKPGVHLGHILSTPEAHAHFGQTSGTLGENLGHTSGKPRTHLGYIWSTPKEHLRHTSGTGEEQEDQIGQKGQ